MNEQKEREIAEIFAQKTIEALEDQRVKHEAFQAELTTQILELRGRNMALSLTVDQLAAKAPQAEQTTLLAALEIALENWPSNLEGPTKMGFQDEKREIESGIRRLGPGSK